MTQGKQILDRVREAAIEGTLTFSDSSIADALKEEIVQVILSLGFEERRARRAFISDESRVGDITSDQTRLTSASQKLGTPVTEGSKFIDLALHLRGGTHGTQRS